MYLLDSAIDPVSLEPISVAVELYQGNFKPIFGLPEALEPAWFTISASQNYLLFASKLDSFEALLELDLDAENFISAVGRPLDKIVKLLG